VWFGGERAAAAVIAPLKWRQFQRSSTMNNRAQAAGLVLVSMGLFGLIDNFMRLAAADGGLWQYHLLRSVVALAVLLPLAAILRISLRPIHPGRVLARTLLNATAMVIYFGCLGFMPIAQVVAGLFTAPLWTVIFTVGLFGDKVSGRQVFAVVLGFAGIIIALHPATGDLTIWTILPVLAGAFYGLGNIVTRRWCGAEGTLTLLGAFFAMLGLVGALGLIALSLWPLPVLPGADGFITRGWVRPSWIFGIVIVVQGLGSLLGVGLSIRAYQIAPPTFVAVFENTLLVFATAWAVILWREWPDVLALVGLLMIATAGVIIALPERRSAPV
jgi:drug/metabolite transporter (DMT)-like permease